MAIDGYTRLHMAIHGYTRLYIDKHSYTLLYMPIHRYTWQYTWQHTANVRTLFQTGKLHQLFTGCADAGIDMIGIQKHRLFTSNSTEELWSEDRKWVFIYGSATNLRIAGGAGFVISKPIYRCLQNFEVISERILHATFHGNPRLSITVVYDPTECGPSTAKDDFYASLAEHLE